jgi:hypothetical protein
MLRRFHFIFCGIQQEFLSAPKNIYFYKMGMGKLKNTLLERPSKKHPPFFPPLFPQRLWPIISYNLVKR